jgi:hypothetical protein
MVSRRLQQEQDLAQRRGQQRASVMLPPRLNGKIGEKRTLVAAVKSGAELAVELSTPWSACLGSRRR